MLAYGSPRGTWGGEAFWGGAKCLALSVFVDCVSGSYTLKVSVWFVIKGILG